MTRLISPVGCCVVVLSLMVAGSAEGAPQPNNPAGSNAAQKPDAQKKAQQKKSDAEKPAAKKPDAQKTPPTKPDAEKTPPAKPATHTVKRELFKVEVSLKGAFEAQSMTEIVVRPDQWKTLQVLKAVEHGRTVAKGDVLVQFDLEEIDRAIADQRTSQRLSELTLEQTEKSLRALEETTPLDLAATERSKQYANEDLERYFEVDLPMSKEYAEFMLKSAQQSLEYQQEELRQLEKMYKADDLTEETEEIILKRQRDAVERAEFYLEQAKLRHQETLEVQLPREEERIKRDTLRQNISSDKSLATLPLALSQQQLELDKLKVAHARGEEKLEKLLADRDAMTVRSPTDGVVYYGKYVRGTWSGATSAADNLRLGGKISPGDVFMTIVKPRPVRVRATVAEKDLHWMRPGLRGTVVPTGYPDLKLNCSVTKIATVPFTAGSFAAWLKVSLSRDADALMPGMACSVKLVPYLERHALTVPAKAVFTDELDERKQYVYLLTKAEKPRRQRVTVGPKSGEKVQILDGLSEGDQILLERPKNDR